MLYDHDSTLQDGPATVLTPPVAVITTSGTYTADDDSPFVINGSGNFIFTVVVNLLTVTEPPILNWVQFQ